MSRDKFSLNSSVTSATILPVVHVYEDRITGSGTAFAVDSRGLLLTAKHVLADGRFLNDSELWPFHDGTYFVLYPVLGDGGVEYEWLPVTHVGYSSRVDIALIRVGLPKRPYIKSWSGCFPVQKIQLGLPTIGERCIAIGCTKISFTPEASKNEIERRVVGGRIKHIFYPYRDKSMLHSPTISLDSELLPGMSGGPVISVESGSVVGVVSSGGLSGISFACLIHRAMCLPTGERELDGTTELLWARVASGTVRADVSGFSSMYNGSMVVSKLRLPDEQQLSLRDVEDFKVDEAGWAIQIDYLGEAEDARCHFDN